MTTIATLDEHDACPLRRAEEELWNGRVSPLSLCPDRSEPTRPSMLIHTLLPMDTAAPLRQAFREGLAKLVSAMRRAFPENIFWDLDALVASVWRESNASGVDRPIFVRERLERMAELQGLFGCETPIRFRYIHDFIYGYDWSKWVQREPDSREAIGPYAPEFIERMHRRGRELLDLIATDDRKYPRLRTEASRNPFGFSREPEDERRLFQWLASQGALPVEAWSTDAAQSPRVDHYRARFEGARRLGLALESA